MAVDAGRIEAAVLEILEAIGEDTSRPGLATTPRRVAEAYADFFAGVGADPREHLRESVPSEANGELVLLRDIDFRSTCEHHLLPFVGVAHVAYLPGERIVGLGRLPRVVETVASRPQLQERATEQIADALHDALAPRGVVVVIDAVHGCVASRGTRQTRSSTVTLASRGVFSDPVARAEVMALIGSGHPLQPRGDHD